MGVPAVCCTHGVVAGSGTLEVNVVDDEIVEAICAGVVELTARKAQVVDDVFDEVDVAAKLERVVAMAKRNRVGKLIAPLIRKRRVARGTPASQRKSHFG